MMMWESSKFAKSAAIEMSSVRQGHFAGQLVRVISVTLLYRSVATTDGGLVLGSHGGGISGFDGRRCSRQTQLVNTEYMA